MIENSFEVIREDARKERIEIIEIQPLNRNMLSQARRAIEISIEIFPIDADNLIDEPWNLIVALRKESVDRNLLALAVLAGPAGVALRKESVDRNPVPAAMARTVQCRSPQGERG